MREFGRASCQRRRYDQPASSSGLGTFKWLNLAQFLGALNDNLFKFFAIFLLINLHWGGPDAELGAARVNYTIGLVFALPFLLFVTLAGILADRWSKSVIAVNMKLLEVAVMALGGIGLWLQSPVLILSTCFLMSLQSALFGPAKYGLIPEIVPPDKIPVANGHIAAFTYIAVILGTILAPPVARAAAHHTELWGAACLLVAVAGWLASMRIARTPAVGGTRALSFNPIGEIWRSVQAGRKDRHILVAMLALGFFLLVAAYVQLNIIAYGQEALGLDKESSALLFLFAAVGIGAGSWLAGRLSPRNAELGVVPIGAVLMMLGCVGLYVLPMCAAGAGARVAAATILFVLGLGGGLFMVPLEAIIQFRSPPERLGQNLAASSWIGWLGVIAAAGLLALNTEVFHLTPSQGFIPLALTTLVLMVVTIWYLPDFLLRFLVIAAMRFFYRIRILGVANVPVRGPALLVCNHVTWLDALLILATQQRRVRYLMDKGMFHRWPLLTPLFKLMEVIPISSDDTPRKLIESLKTARTALEEGWLVGIFAEGALTRSGMMMQFRPGYERIVKGLDVPLVPVFIGGAWGSIFSYQQGRILGRLPRRIPYPITIAFGAPLPSTAKPHELQLAVQELSCEVFEDRKARRRSMGEEFLRSARLCWGRIAMADTTTGKPLKFGQAAVASFAFARAFRARLAGDETNVGVLLPPSCGGALTNLALVLDGRVPVNLNYTASPSAFASAVRQAGIRTIITSKAFLEKLAGSGMALDLSVPTLELKEVVAGITLPAKLLAFWRARFRRIRAVRPQGFTGDTLATIIFSSGSTATPKGVMLSHHNLLSNIESFRSIARTTADDCMISALPFFHSFGFTCTLWFPMISGFRAAYHVNPLEAGKIGELAGRYQGTMLVATPTFLQAYMRRVEPKDFAAMRLVFVGAEKLRPALAARFQETFGVRPFEGYGATECSPVIAVSVPDLEIDGVFQKGFREGMTGQPLPGIALKIVDPETRAPLPPGTEGLLLVRGPNVMLGYLGQPEKTAEVLRDGWYVTGDIARIDEDAFMVITDRLSRFSKIGGEMVPHHAVEEELHRVAGMEGRQVFVVTSVPDDRKGEKLVVLHTDEAGDIEKVREGVALGGLPNLWKPARDAYLRVPAIPLLGTGKTDLQAVKRIALEGRVSG
ncbi:MAG: acyl-[ACP]--phospholipid O-acyltransferase [Kiritimatiellia bacterium]